MKLKNKYKSGFIVFYSNYIYLQIIQNFIDAFYTYLKFNNIIFDYSFKN